MASVTKPFIGIAEHDMKYLSLVSVPDPKPTPARIDFSIPCGLNWKRCMCQMRSGDETRLSHYNA